MPQRIGRNAKKNRSFIKPGAGTKFKLVNRSIRDLGGYVDGAGQHVLAPIDEKYEDLDEHERQNVEREYGVDFSDGYNYMQHLKVRIVFHSIFGQKYCGKKMEKFLNFGPKFRSLTKSSILDRNFDI